MSEGLVSPVLVKSIPDIQANEGSPLQQLDFSQFIQNPEGQVSEITFSATLLGGNELPQGVLCADTGLFMGVPAKGSAAELPYDIEVTANNGADEPLVATFKLTILESLAGETQDDELDEDDALDDSALEDVDLEALLEEVASSTISQSEVNEQKSAVWDAILKELDIPSVEALLDREATYDDIYYLLSRFAHFVIWNADDMAAPGDLENMSIEGISEHFEVFDRGSCLVAAPKSLFDHSRGLMDGVTTARAMAKEAFNRGWNIEFGGFDKMVSAAWVETRCLMEEFNKDVEVRHYQPTYHDYQLYSQIRGIS